MADETKLLFQTDTPGITQFSTPRMSPEGFQIVVDWYTYQLQKGRCFQIRAGTISVPLVGDVVITDTAAEMCVDAPADNMTIIPIYCNISINLGTGTVHEYQGKSVATVSSSGTAFVPLPLKSDGGDAASTARVQAAGAVTVTAELATTTLRHFGRGGAIAHGAYLGDLEWEPRVPPQLIGPRCFYVQVAAAGTGPSYFASIDYIERASVELP